MAFPECSPATMGLTWQRPKDLEVRRALMRAAKRWGEVSRAEHKETALEAMDGQGELRRGLTRSVTVTEESDGAQRWVSEKLEVIEHGSTEYQRACQKVDGSDGEVTQKRGLGPKDE